MDRKPTYEELKQRVMELEKETAKRIRAEKALQKEKQEKEAILDSLTEHIVYHDTEHKVLWANRAAGESVDLAPEKLVGRYCYEIWQKRTKPCPGCPVEKAIESGQPQEAEMSTPDGRVWFIQGNPVRNENGDITGGVETTLEITKRKQAQEALRESQEKYQLLAESLLDGIYEFDLEGRFIYVNEAAAHMFRYSKDEALSDIRVEDIIVEEDKVTSRKAIGDVLKGKTTVGERTFIRKDGSRFIGEIHSGPIYKGKDIVGIRGIVRDITERKQAQEALRESEEKYKNLFQSSLHGIAESDLEGNLISCNMAYSKMTGHSEEELKNLKYQEITPEKWAEVDKKHVEQCLQKGYSDLYEKERIKKDGTIIPISIRMWLRRDGQGNPVGLWHIVRDITDRKRAEEALRESEEKYRSLVESTEDSVYLVDRNCRYLFVNKKHLSRFTLPIGKVIGRAYGDFHSEEETKGFEEKVKEVFETGKSLSYEYRSQRDGGYFLRTLSPVKEPDGETTAVTVVSKNISERKRAEEAFRQAAALKTLTTVLENFIGDSLGNLLFIVYGQLGLCGVNDNIAQIRSNISDATQGLNELIQGIQAYQEFSSLTEGSLGDISSVALGSVLEPLLSGEPLQTYQKKRFPINPKVKLRFVYDPGQQGALSWEELPPVSGSKRAIATALQETLINAVESYDPGKGGHVMVSAKKEDRNLIIEIADKGRGMGNEQRDKSQLPFFKILGMKGSARLGLGAYIARQSAEYCGGDIHIESREGVGTTASILLKVSDQVS